ncbi:MAG: hypothetical protein ACI8RA_002392 [Chlamydiales bacterium]|jgi:hypothetical protein
MVNLSDPLLKNYSRFEQESEASTTASDQEETLSQRIDSLRSQTALHLHKVPDEISKEEMKLYFKGQKHKQEKKLARKKKRLIVKASPQGWASLPQNELNKILGSPEEFLFKINEERGLSAQRYIELRLRTAKDINKYEEDVTKREMDGYLGKLQDRYEKKKATTLSVISCFLIIHQMAKLSTSLEELQESDQSFIKKIKTGALSRDQICARIPSSDKLELLYWEEILCALNDPILIYNVAKKELNHPEIDKFPLLQQHILIKACKRIIQISKKKAQNDQKICRLLSFPERKAQILCKYASQKDDTNKSFLDRQTEDIINMFSSSKEEISEKSTEVITMIVNSQYVEEEVQKLRKEILGMHSTFDLESFLHSFDHTIFHLISQFNSVNMEIVQQAFGKGQRTKTAGEDEFLPMAVYLIHRMNDSEVYGRLQGLSNMEDMSLLSSHQQFLFTRAIGASMAARSMIEEYSATMPPEIKKSPRSVAARADAFLTWIKGTPRVIGRPGF